MKYQITKLTLLDFFNGELSVAEEVEVLEWRDACDEHRKLFDDMRKEHLRIRWAVRAQLIKGDYSSISKRINKKVFYHTLQFWYRVAAIGIVAISSVLLSYHFLDEGQVKDFANFGPPAHTAILELSDGTCHYIGSEKTELKEKNGSQLAINSGELIYDKNKSGVIDQEDSQEEVIYNL